MSLSLQYFIFASGAVRQRSVRRLDPSGYFFGLLAADWARAEKLPFDTLPLLPLAVELWTREAAFTLMGLDLDIC